VSGQFHSQLIRVDGRRKAREDAALFLERQIGNRDLQVDGLLSGPLARLYSGVHQTIGRSYGALPRGITCDPE
jgi:hypothetical protein